MRGEEKRGGKRSGEEKRGEEKEGEEYTFRNQQEFMMFLNNVPRVNVSHIRTRPWPVQNQLNMMAFQSLRWEL